MTMKRMIFSGILVIGLSTVAFAQTPLAPADPVSPEKSAPERIRETLPSVVNIQTDRSFRFRPERPAGFLSQFFFDYFEKKMPRKIEFRTKAEGSGVVLEAGGVVLTNAHVIEGADHIRVVLADKREFNARVLGKDTKEDLALLEMLAAPVLPEIALGDSEKLAQADDVYAVGSPLGYRQTITKGIVSAVHRELKAGNEVLFEDLIQTDTSLNPGNSGGPLLNTEGQMIGLVNSGHPGARGIGFAIPVNRIKTMLEALRTGAAQLEKAETFRRRFGFVPETKITDTGSELVLGAILPESPAARAGLRKNDVLLSFHVWTYENIDQMLDAAAHLNPGDRIRVLIHRSKRPFFTYLEVPR